MAEFHLFRQGEPVFFIRPAKCPLVQCPKIFINVPVLTKGKVTVVRKDHFHVRVRLERQKRTVRVECHPGGWPPPPYLHRVPKYDSLCYGGEPGHRRHTVVGDIDPLTDFLGSKGSEGVRQAIIAFRKRTRG